ncbi:MAG: NAD(P)H-dependent glycerol-3-phosphate dehydrogenase, partial [Acidimicrobiales bacterium]
HGARQVLASVAPCVHPGVPIVSLAKGLEQETLARVTEVIREVLPGHPTGVLTGPNLAREVMDGHAAVSVVAMDDMAAAARIQSVFATGQFRVYTNHDVIGCEIGGSLKNVIAIATGMAQSLDVGDNTRAAVMTRGLSELTRLGMAMGGEQATFAGIAGMGDLLATCMSPQSRNRRLGEELGKGRLLSEILAGTRMVAEGVRTADAVMRLSHRHGIEMPICERVHGVLTGTCTPREAYDGLLQRQVGHERD